MGQCIETGGTVHSGRWETVQRERWGGSISDGLDCTQWMVSQSTVTGGKCTVAEGKLKRVAEG
jgi:hypothetical protein